MKKINKPRLVSVSVVGAIVAIAVFYLNYSRGYGILRCLCDGFFVAAVLLIGVGGIMFTRNKGAFDVAGYGLSTAFFTMFPSLRQNDPEDLMGYIERKQEERKPATELLIAGVIYLLLSVIVLIVYTTAK